MSEPKHSVRISIAPSIISTNRISIANSGVQEVMEEQSKSASQNISIIKMSGDENARIQRLSIRSQPKESKGSMSLSAQHSALSKRISERKSQETPRTSKETKKEKKKKHSFDIIYGEGEGATDYEGKSIQRDTVTQSPSSSSTAEPSSSESNKSIENEVGQHHGEEEQQPEGDLEDYHEHEITDSGRISSVLSVEEEEVEEEETPFISVFDRLDVERPVLDVPDVITPEMLKKISVDLGQIRLCWPKKEKIRIDFMPNVILPDGYLMNTNKEKVLLLYTENFRVQYHARFPNRKPLLLCGDNVAGQRVNDIKNTTGVISSLYFVMGMCRKWCAQHCVQQHFRIRT